MVNIDNIIVNDDVLNSNFCCDLSECKGICCCLKGGKGAPLADDEIKILEDTYKKIRKNLSPDSLEAIKTYGLYEGMPGEYYISCIRDQDCVFVYYENEIAKCAIEKAYFDGLVKWRKPISCHLYPIRINDFGGDVLRYSRISECFPAIKNGKKRNVLLIDFLKEPLCRKYGEEWFKRLKKNQEIQKINYSV